MEKFTQEVAKKVRDRFESVEVKDVLAAIEKATPADTGTFEVVITTENLDRYQEVIALDGWDIAHYLNNPVVLWGHDHQKLIGMATSMEIVDGKMIAKGKFAPTELGQETRQLYDAGFLKATSVGFIEKERQGNLITKAELLEFSFVSVPANPYALSLAMKKELSVNELVTKGFMHVEKDAEDVPPEDDKPAEPELTDEQKHLAAFIVKEVVTALKDGALETAPEGESEGTEQEEEETETEDEKIFAVKKTMQSLDTTLGEVLAELRQKHSPTA